MFFRLEVLMSAESENMEMEGWRQQQEQPSVVIQGIQIKDTRICKGITAADNNNCKRDSYKSSPIIQRTHFFIHLSYKVEMFYGQNDQKLIIFEIFL